MHSSNSRVRAIGHVAERRVSESLCTRLLKAQEEERKTIARELHDQIGQGIAVLLMELHRLEAELAPGASSRKTFQGIVKLVQEHESTVRDMELSLRPSMLDDLGLIPTLNWHARDIARRTGMKVTVDADCTCDLLSDDYRTGIFRMVQETLNNAVCHSKASSAQVIVRQEPSQLRVEVRDDGCGFGTRYAKGGGMLEMEERARQLGGSCHVDSKPGCGARVSILLPRRETLTAHGASGSEGISA